ncbi:MULTISPECIES: hypothetical protein [unclassified Roseateles]|uniref:hypothetical protein n=1 Tax=unclassified Roseateles TaxID=2626991 RepID=UPI0006F75A16|nr:MULTISPECIES: hypothetical protein [unclassified Roseateles]KQW42779.1 hypothetical protein ASC81_19150 [Pelomonas sp. Root405]KRA69456.1 hypothetical protein ASD88_19800 [Pelomonas sp. Root662]
MDRLPEQIVAWHNRHPLARRIAVGDVHTIGVVALPFVRASAEAGGLVEPVLTDAVTFDELAAAPRQSRLAAWRQRLLGIARLLGRRPRTQWRAFNEKFLPGLSPAGVERFALAHGFVEPPATPDTRPWRVIVIDESMASAHSGWPFELYLMTAGIDVGSGRTRVLAGRGIPSEIAGRRLWDARRVGAAAAVVVLLTAAGAWALWPQRAAAPLPAPPLAASAASAASPIASAPPGLASAMPASAPEPALAASAASATVAGASGPGSAASETAADEAQPDIRPRLVERTDGIKRPPLRSSKPVDAATEKPVDASAPTPAAPPADKPVPAASKPEPVDPRLSGLAQSPDKIVVALVGPPVSKADAEALLKKMQAGLVGVHSNPSALQADVIQTPEGWRATVWPFSSREQAQLINATLVARGLRTKAVNF